MIYKLTTPKKSPARRLHSCKLIPASRLFECWSTIMRPASILMTSFFCFFVTLTAGAQDAKPPDAGPAKLSVAKMIHETVTVTNGDAKLSCYLARQDSPVPLPGLLLIHEWWGLNDWVKQQADRYAQKGYVVLAVDLYRGEVAADRDHAHELMRGLSDDRAMADLRAGFDYLAKLEATKGQPIGVMGWCMGGGFALKLAIVEPKVAATVVCYGRPVTDVAELRKIKGPVLGIWGETDRGIEVEPFKKALAEAGVKATHHIYPGAGHAFLNENNKKGYNAEQAKKGWAEIDRFLSMNLRRS
jgi:carboxymethylenebutenolidase